MAAPIQPDYTRWNEGTLAWICCNSDYIRQIAGKLGVPPEAIAGFMAKENDSLRKRLAEQQQAERLEVVAKPHRHFFHVIMRQANWKKRTNILT